MMQKFLLIILLSFQITKAQKTYSFDYELNYTFISDSSKIYNHKYFLNSRDNNYQMNLITSTIDTLKYDLYLSIYDYAYLDTDVDKNEFETNEKLNVPCNNIFKYTNIYKKKAKEYSYFNYEDTLINGISYYHYALKSNKRLKCQKRKKLAQKHFIVTKEHKDFLPFLNFSTALEVWNNNKNSVPNGIVYMTYILNYKNEIKNLFLLKSIKPSKKELIIPKDCEIQPKYGGLIIRNM